MTLTYKDVGVDVGKADDFVKDISTMALSTHNSSVVSTGGYAGIFQIPQLSNKLAATCDGVGTKLLVAKQAGKYDTVGIDLVAMNVNDLAAAGAKPLFFLDYIATGALNKEELKEVFEGITAGCIQSGCALLGGETAEMPDMYKPGDFDLAGFAVGVMQYQPPPKPMKPGQAIIALPSNGVHSNGFSLVRKALPNPNKEVLEDLLRPTRIYVNEVEQLLRKYHVYSMAHITGGGLLGRLNKMTDLCFDVNLEHLRIPRIFELISIAGNIEFHEMIKVFNMGVGFVAVVDRKDAEEIVGKINEWFVLGELKTGSGDIKLTGGRR